ncbi:phosphatidate cytidylyltransferase [Candidatus Poribacteria bacterium]|nr:phosphatidate cytidylyltransferase [Candidatus Poribacteria bacterium]
MITELLRKTTHLSGLFIPLLYITLDKPVMLIIVGSLTATALFIEFLKWVSEGFRNLFFRYFKSILRTHEQKGALTGATFYILSTFLCILFFQKNIAIVCILFVVLGDAVAALVGIKWGRTKLIGNKSLEGSGACLLVCASISLIWLNPIIGIVGAFVATVVEILPLRIDDNLTVSLISGIVMQLMMMYLPF